MSGYVLFGTPGPLTRGASSVRRRTPSLRYADPRCSSTVRGLRKSSAAISLFVRPSTAASATWSLALAQSAERSSSSLLGLDARRAQPCQRTRCPRARQRDARTSREPEQAAPSPPRVGACGAASRRGTGRCARPRSRTRSTSKSDRLSRREPRSRSLPRAHGSVRGRPPPRCAPCIGSNARAGGSASSRRRADQAPRRGRTGSCRGRRNRPATRPGGSADGYRLARARPGPSASRPPQSATRGSRRGSTSTSSARSGRLRLARPRRRPASRRSRRAPSDSRCRARSREARRRRPVRCPSRRAPPAPRARTTRRRAASGAHLAGALADAASLGGDRPSAKSSRYMSATLKLASSRGSSATGRCCPGTPRRRVSSAAAAGCERPSPVRAIPGHPRRPELGDAARVADEPERLGREVSAAVQSLR